jgi:hypothetical protein
MGDFENCPKAFYHKRIAKDVKEEQGEAATWGDQVHKFFEYVIKDMQGLPLSATETTLILQGKEGFFKSYLPIIEALFAYEADEMHAELQMAIDKTLQPCDWFAKTVWCRGIIDVLLIKGDRARAIDWKTGKRKVDSKQLKLFALLVFIFYPHVNTVKTDFVWLKTNERDSEIFTRAQEAELWQEFLPSLAKFNTAFKLEIFPPRKSGLCNGWCPVTSCEFWAPKRVK